MYTKKIFNIFGVDYVMHFIRRIVMIFLLHKTGENIYTKCYLVIKNIFNIKRKKGVFRFLHSLASDPFFYRCIGNPRRQNRLEF